jgi:Tfp pilus assembly protein PilZ
MIQHHDNGHLAFATSQGRALYSFNASDYLALHSECLMQGRHHSGIILAQQQRYSVGEQMRRLLRIINFRSAEVMQDQVEFLSAWG